METLTATLDWLDGWLGSAAYFPILLLGVGLFFTVYLGFPQVRYFKRAWGTLLGRHTRKDAAGDTSHFQALATALSGTVGTGNIAGVALAIHLGGPAALFWMWVTAFLGMATKFVEVTVSHKYRVFDEKGEVAGGPMYYMERGLNMKWLAVFFAAATVVSTLGSGNMPQSNSLASGLHESFDIPPAVSGAVLALLLALVIVGGIKWIARVASAIVPVMGVFYAIGAFAVVAGNLETVGVAFASVFRDALSSGSAASGGFLGASFAYAFNRGVARGLFSNEAGQGSAPIAHASARGDEPVSEGLVSLLEPFIDTLVVCTLTGMVIIASGVWQEKFDTEFQAADTEYLAGAYHDDDADDVARLYEHLGGGRGLLGFMGGGARSLPAAEGRFRVEAGRLAPNAPLTILHNRSVAEDVSFLRGGGVPYSGHITLRDGRLVEDLTLTGKSLLHSVPMTAEAFKRSFLGFYGQYAVTIGLVLFAFSTAIAWSYYGDRAMTYLFGVKTVLPYRLAYAGFFFVAAIMDTSLVWLLSAISLALMALPNLLGILLLRREMRALVRDYRVRFERRGASGGDDAG